MATMSTTNLTPLFLPRIELSTTKSHPTIRASSSSSKQATPRTGRQLLSTFLAASVAVVGLQAVANTPVATAYLSQDVHTAVITLPESRKNSYAVAANQLVDNMSEGTNMKNRGTPSSKVKAFPDLPLMAVIVEHMEGQRDMITTKSVWHLNDETMKNVYTMYIMFTCWGCCFFGAMKDPYYDSEQYRKEGGDGTGHWVYEKQEDIEESARAELWREELIEEIEQKVGGLRELEEAGKKEELVK